MLIALSGIDCAGKSTQIERLSHALEARGRRPLVFWFRPGYSREMDALRAAVRRLRPGALPTADRVEVRREVFARPGVRRTWAAAALSDTVLQYAVKLRGHLLAGRTVICDRWLDDARLDLTLRFPDLTGPLDAAHRLIERVCPRPDRHLLLTVPHDEMLRRMAIKDEPFPDPPDVRDRRYDAYLRLAEGDRIHAVDGARPPEEVHREVLAALGLNEGSAP
ncbi:MAG: dTMP kinase [Myxococcota bacterium]